VIRSTSARAARSGFTLIEIVVALAVLAVAMGALISGMARYADNAGALRERTLALWVAHNRLTEIDLEPAWPTIGKSDGDVELAGVDWRWFVEVIETPDPDVRRINIRVQLKGREKEGDAAQLSAFSAKTDKSP
jgi:general secretion pathway protein I